MQKIYDALEDILKEKGVFVQTENGEYFYFLLDTKTLISLNPENNEYKRLLISYRINPKMPVYRFIFEAVQLYCMSYGKFAIVSKFARYCDKNNTVYIKCGKNQFYKITTASIELCDNGTDGVLFSDIIASEPFEYAKNKSGKDFITDKIISLFNFNSTALDINTQRTLAKAYFLSLFMPEFLATKPILTVIGSKGSGKTTLLKAFVKTLYGRKHNVCSVPNKLADLDVLVANSHFLALDNWDIYKNEYNDNVAMYSTGGTMKKRKLYTDGTMYEANFEAFIGMSTQALNMRRPDILQRMLLLEVNPVSGGYIAETELMKPITDYRNEIMSQAIDEIQRILQIIESKKYEGQLRAFRMADFAKFLTIYLDSAEQADEYLAEMTKYQKAVSTENDVLLGYLAAFAEKYSEKYYNAQEMYKLIVDFDKDNLRPQIKTEFEKNYENVFSFAKRINNLKNDIKEYLLIETRKGRANQTEYRIQKGEKFDELDKSVIQHNIMESVTSEVL